MLKVLRIVKFSVYIFWWGISKKQSVKLGNNILIRVVFKGYYELGCKFKSKLLGLAPGSIGVVPIVSV